MDPAFASIISRIRSLRNCLPAGMRRSRLGTGGVGRTRMTEKGRKGLDGRDDAGRAKFVKSLNLVGLAAFAFRKVAVG